MAKLICNNGTEIKISDETEAELRKAFGPKEKDIRVYAFYAAKNEGCSYKLALSGPYSDEMFPEKYQGRSGFDKKDIQKIIKGLQELIGEN